MSQSKFSIVISINKEVWGTWTLESHPGPKYERELKQAISRRIKDSSFPDHEWHVDIIENIHCDNFQEMLAGIEESISNEFDQDID